MYGWNPDSAVVAFEMNGRHVRFSLPMPDRSDPEFTETPTGRARKQPQQAQAYEQAVKQRWRALALVIKAKMEAVESGITEFDEEFLAHIVLPDGQTVGSWMLPQVAEAYEHGQMPRMLPAPE